MHVQFDTMDTIGRTSPDCGESSRRTGRLRSNSRDLWDKLDDAIAESILARTPMADLFRSQLVCRRWSSLIHSPSFQSTCQQLSRRRPWFYMLDEQSPVNVVYDMEVNNWRHANLPVPTDDNGSPRAPVAANGSLMCFKSEAGVIIACNPLTGWAHSILRPETNGSIRAVAMYTNQSIYKVFIIFEKGHDFFLKMFSLVENTWVENILKISVCNHVEVNNPNGMVLLQGQEEGDMVDIVDSIIEWTPMKVLPAVTLLGSDGQVMVYYLSPSGKLVGCDTHQHTITMYRYPWVFLQGEICAIDVVECGGRILVLVLKEDLGTAVLRVWEFKPEEPWKLLAAMPPNMSHAYYGLAADINCAGQGDYVMVCVTSENSDFNQVVMYNIIEDSWVELPRCLDRRGEHFKRFVCVYSFVPNIHANV